MKTEPKAPELSDATQLQPEPSVDLNSVTSEVIPPEELSPEPELEVDIAKLTSLEERREANLRRNSAVMKQVIDQFEAGKSQHIHNFLFLHRNDHGEEQRSAKRQR
jgi:hypothetical protein